MHLRHVPKICVMFRKQWDLNCTAFIGVQAKAAAKAATGRAAAAPKAAAKAAPAQAAAVAKPKAAPAERRPAGDWFSP